MARYQHKIIMGVCMPRALKEAIDQRGGDIPRSKYISRILERQLVYENEVANQRNASRPLPGQSSADSLRFPTTTYLGVDAANGTKELKKRVMITQGSLINAKQESLSTDERN
jgi:hypothetical protein